MEQSVLFSLLKDIPCSLTVKQEFFQLFNPLSLGKGQLWTGPEHDCSICVMHDGLIQYHRKHRENGNTELVLHFLRPSEPFLLPRHRSVTLYKDYLLALHPSTFFYCGQEAIYRLTTRLPEATRILFSLSELWVQKFLEERTMLHLEPAALRYEALKAEFGLTIHQLPKQALASYLQITPKHLSRIECAWIRKKK